MRGRIVSLIVGVYLVVGALIVLGCFLESRRTVRQLVTTYAAEFAQQQRAAILARVERELVLAKKLAGSPLLVDWIHHEDDPARRKLALDELDSYRPLFSDHSWFVAFEPHRHYYYNDAKNQFRGQELRYTLSPDDLANHWYFATLANVTDYGLHVDHSEKLDVTKLWFNVVILDGEKRVGVAGGGTDLTSFLKSVVRSPRPGVLTILVDRYGAIQGHPDESLMWANANAYDESKRTTIASLVSPADRPVVQGVLDRLQGDEPGLESFEVRYQGRPMVAAAASMPNLEWDVLVLVDPSLVAQFSLMPPLLGLLAGAFLIAVPTWLLISSFRSAGKIL